MECYRGQWWDCYYLLFHINELDDNVSQFADYAKIVGIAGSEEGYLSPQHNLDQWEHGPNNLTLTSVRCCTL